jgi:hypothetical protein
MTPEHSFFSIHAIELICPNVLRCGDSIVYDAAQHTLETTECIFFGPYSTLDPGIHLFGFNGQLEGDLAIDFADQNGTVLLKKLTINSFLDPVCLAVTKALAKFEVRGFNTPLLNSLKLDSISVEVIGFPAPRNHDRQ